MRRRLTSKLLLLLTPDRRRLSLSLLRLLLILNGGLWLGLGGPRRRSSSASGAVGRRRRSRSDQHPPSARQSSLCASPDGVEAASADGAHSAGKERRKASSRGGKQAEQGPFHGSIGTDRTSVDSNPFPVAEESPRLERTGCLSIPTPSSRNESPSSPDAPCVEFPAQRNGCSKCRLYFALSESVERQIFACVVATSRESLPQSPSWTLDRAA